MISPQCLGITASTARQRSVLWSTDFLYSLTQQEEYYHWLVRTYIPDQAMHFDRLIIDDCLLSIDLLAWLPLFFFFQQTKIGQDDMHVVQQTLVV